MGRLEIVVDDEVEARFRAAVAARLGMRRGNLSKAVEEAIVAWIGGQHP